MLLAFQDLRVFRDSSDLQDLLAIVVQLAVQANLANKVSLVW